MSRFVTPVVEPRARAHRGGAHASSDSGEGESDLPLPPAPPVPLLPRERWSPLRTAWKVPASLLFGRCAPWLLRSEPNKFDDDACLPHALVVERSSFRSCCFRCTCN